MTRTEFIELLKLIRRQPWDSTAQDAVDDLIAEYDRLTARVAELKAENERLSKYVDENETRKLMEFKANLKRSIEVDPLAKERKEDEG